MILDISNEKKPLKGKKNKEKLKKFHIAAKLSIVGGGGGVETQTARNCFFFSRYKSAWLLRHLIKKLLSFWCTKSLR